MKHRVLFVLTSNDTMGVSGAATGAYLPEISHPHAVFTSAGCEVEFASVKGGKVPLDGMDNLDAVSSAFLADDTTQRRMHDSIPPAAIDPQRYDAIFYAGGHGTMWDFPDQPELERVAAETYESGGVVGAVCHGPAGLLNVRLSNGTNLIDGKQVAAFTNDEERAVKLDTVVPFLLADALVARGAKHAPAPNWQPQVVVSDRLVTGQNPASARGVAEAMLRLLDSHERDTAASGSP